MTQPETVSREWIQEKERAIADARARGTDERERLKARLYSEGAHDLAMKLEGCGTEFPLVCCNCGNRKSVHVACKRRWCPSCAWLVQRERLARFEIAGEMMRWPLFVTLTVPNSNDPECIREVRAAWGRMRRRKIFAGQMNGGVSTIEVTNTGNGWHPHLHILGDCEWLSVHTPKPRHTDSEAVKRQKYDCARDELRRVWANVLGLETAVVLAIRKAPGEALRYAMKYAVKGSELIESKEPIAPLLRVLSRSRMISAFGNLHGKLGTDTEEERPAIACDCCGEIKTWVPETVEDRARTSAYDQSNALR